ncbi:hypothetical protein ABT354_26520 [Streptomyces sp. NPDC000594]|uniref:hypothetical protein n=1 Tax=Streptomyces sp. NPDC000594 TaxID=3154261 RepID=UPI003329FA33
MMPHSTPAPGQICPDCDGFPVVAITTGPRPADSTRPTTPVSCPTCHGTGTVAPARRVVTV